MGYNIGVDLGSVRMGEVDTSFNEFGSLNLGTDGGNITSDYQHQAANQYGGFSSSELDSMDFDTEVASASSGNITINNEYNAITSGMSETQANVGSINTATNVDTMSFGQGSNINSSTMSQGSMNINTNSGLNLGGNINANTATSTQSSVQNMNFDTGTMGSSPIGNNGSGLNTNTPSMPSMPSNPSTPAGPSTPGVTNPSTITNQHSSTNPATPTNINPSSPTQPGSTNPTTPGSSNQPSSPTQPSSTNPTTPGSSSQSFSLTQPGSTNPTVQAQNLAMTGSIPGTITTAVYNSQTNQPTVSLLAVRTEAEATTKEDRILYIYDQLRRYGFSDLGAKAIISHINIESPEFSSNQWQNNDPNQPGYGLCQWEFSANNGCGTADEMVEWCWNNGLDCTTIDGQLAWLAYHVYTKLNSMVENGGPQLYLDLINPNLTSFDDLVSIAKRFGVLYEGQEDYEAMAGRAYIARNDGIFDLIDGDRTI